MPDPSPGVVRAKPLHRPPCAVPPCGQPREGFARQAMRPPQHGAPDRPAARKGHLPCQDQEATNPQVKDRAVRGQGNLEGPVLLGFPDGEGHGSDGRPGDEAGEADHLRPVRRPAGQEPGGALPAGARVPLPRAQLRRRGRPTAASHCDRHFCVGVQARGGERQRLDAMVRAGPRSHLDEPLRRVPVPGLGGAGCHHAAGPGKGGEGDLEPSAQAAATVSPEAHQDIGAAGGRQRQAALPGGQVQLECRHVACPACIGALTDPLVEQQASAHPHPKGMEERMQEQGVTLPVALRAAADRRGRPVVDRQAAELMVARRVAGHAPPQHQQEARVVDQVLQHDLACRGHPGLADLDDLGRLPQLKPQASDPLFQMLAAQADLPPLPDRGHLRPPRLQDRPPPMQGRADGGRP